MIAATSSPTATLSATPKSRQVVGYVLTGLCTLFLVFDTVIKLSLAPEAVQGSAELGFTSSDVLTLGVLELVLLVLYLVPRTAVFGAVLWTGYLGGAIATHFRLHNPLFTHVLFPIYIGLLLWGGLWLRDASLRKLFPLRRVG